MCASELIPEKRRLGVGLSQPTYLSLFVAITSNNYMLGVGY